MEFRDVERRVFHLYRENKYELGLRVIAGARVEHPDQDGRLTFWEACLLSVSGLAHEALEVLSAGLDRGLWWDPRMLEDSDLDRARDQPGWNDMVNRSAKAAYQVETRPPQPRVRLAARGTRQGTLVTLHGAGADPTEHANAWEAATPESWTVITPAGTVPMSPRGWAWPFDLSPECLSTQLDGLELVQPLVLAGWSQGGGMAATTAWKGRHEVRGLLLVGPGLRYGWDPRAHRPIPTFLVVGEYDLNLEPCLELRDRMTRHGVPVHLDRRAGLGHEPPEDLKQTIEDALGWLSANEPRR